MGQLLLEHFHGAVTRVGVTDTAFPHRAQGYNMLVLSEWMDPRTEVHRLGAGLLRRASGRSWAPAATELPRRRRARTTVAAAYGRTTGGCRTQGEVRSREPLPPEPEHPSVVMKDVQPSRHAVAAFARTGDHGTNTMRIAKIEDLHCDAGWRTCSFLKITTDEGIVGWSEYNESYGSRGLTAVIRKLAERLIGQDPRPVERSRPAHAITRQAPGGMIQQAIAAIENALVDIKARALGVPVYELLGGPMRDRLRLYWSHCGTYRLAMRDHGRASVRSLDDIGRSAPR